MSTPRTVRPAWTAVTMALLAGCAAPVATPPGAGSPLGLGRLASADELRGWNIDVTPDGQGLPAGSGTVAEGRALFAQRCSACHGSNGQGATAPPLVGGLGSMTQKSPLRTVGSFWPYAPTVFDYVYRSMPFDKPQSLTAPEVYALTAFLLHANGIVAADAVMNARTLPAVAMPNRNGFVPTPPRADVQGTRCMHDCLK